MANAHTWIWIALLVAILAFAARVAFDLAPRTHEYAYGCDSFGFLSQAKSIREAVATTSLPEFHIETTQTRLLIDDLTSRRIPSRRWGELVAPHAHHYMKGSGQVGVQYPPGTGLALAVFPAGEAVAGLARAAIASLVAVGLAALFVAGRRRAVASAGLVVLAVVLGFDLMVRHATASYSILAVVPPLLIAAALTALAASQCGRAPRRASIVAFAAGACLGFALLVRIPSVLMIPGYLLLLLPRSPFASVATPERLERRRRHDRFFPILSLLAAFGLIGVVPLLFHQQLVAGSWYRTTYSEGDANLPKLIDPEALRYYLGGGGGSGELWALLPAIGGAIAAIALSTRGRRHPSSTSQPRGDDERGVLTWPRVIVAASAIWLLSTVFFLSHFPRTPYYGAPGVFAAIAVLAFGALAIEARRRAPAASETSGLRLAVIVTIALALVPAAAAAARAARFERLMPSQITRPALVELPAELADERAWVWADELTGTFWYYQRKPAFKIPFSSERTRAEMFGFVHDRGEPQFIVRDSPTIGTIIAEIEAQGGVLEPRGSVAGVPYFSIHWPARPAVVSR